MHDIYRFCKSQLFHLHHILFVASAKHIRIPILFPSEACLYPQFYPVTISFGLYGFIQIGFLV